MTTAWVTYTFPAWHSWPGAPTERAYLGALHRHLFHVRAELDVFHDDRELEFHDVLDELRNTCAALGTFHPSGRDLGSMSCEQIALRIALELQRRWPRHMRVDVSEDGETGATVELHGKK